MGIRRTCNEKTQTDINISIYKIFKNNNCSFELMHTNSSYPMQPEEANLKCIETLKNETIKKYLMIF